MLLPEAYDALVIGDQRTGKLDRGGDQQPIGRVTMLETMELVGAGRSVVAQWECFNSWAIDEALDPRLDRNIQFNPTGVDQESDLPGGHCAEENGAAAQPAFVDQKTRGRAQAFVAAVEP